MKAFISLENVNKTYGIVKETAPNHEPSKKPALSNISLTIDEGERVGIIGENGAGKSTLLSIIAGIYAASSGRVQVEGQVNALLSIGLGLREDFTGRENFYLCGELQGKSRKEIDLNINEMIEFSELEEFIDLPVRIYSSGMKSKLSFTSSVFIHPEILIIDEALSVGDRWFVGKASNKMKQLCDTGKILILVSHSLGSIVDMCNRCIWLHDGQIKADGLPKQVTDDYQQFIRKRSEERVKADFISLPKKLATDTSHHYLKNLTFKLNGINSEMDQVLVEENMDFAVSVELTTDSPLLDPLLYFKMERLDGLSIISDYLPEISLLSEQKPIRTTVECGSMKLRPGYYKCVFSLENNKRLIDTLQGVFQVSSEIMVSGGNPALRWSTDCHTKQISQKIHEEVNV